jgi:hypothetical protein
MSIELDLDGGPTNAAFRPQHPAALNLQIVAPILDLPPLPPTVAAPDVAPLRQTLQGVAPAPIVFPTDASLPDSLRAIQAIPLGSRTEAQNRAIGAVTPGFGRVRRPDGSSSVPARTASPRVSDLVVTLDLRSGAGLLVAWSGSGLVSHTSLQAALGASHTAPSPKHGKALLGDAIRAVTRAPHSCRSFRGAWTIGVTRTGAIDESFGTIVATATWDNGAPKISGDKWIAAEIQSEYDRRLDLIPCDTLTPWVFARLTGRTGCNGVQFGNAVYIPPQHFDRAKALIKALKSVGYGLAWLSVPCQTTADLESQLSERVLSESTAIHAEIATEIAGMAVISPTVAKNRIPAIDTALARIDLYRATLSNQTPGIEPALKELRTLLINSCEGYRPIELYDSPVAVTRDTRWTED